MTYYQSISESKCNSYKKGNSEKIINRIKYLSVNRDREKK